MRALFYRLRTEWPSICVQVVLFMIIPFIYSIPSAVLRLASLLIIMIILIIYEFVLLPYFTVSSYFFDNRKVPWSKWHVICQKPNRWKLRLLKISKSSNCEFIKEILINDMKSILAGTKVDTYFKVYSHEQVKRYLQSLAKKGYIELYIKYVNKKSLALEHRQIIKNTIHNNCKGCNKKCRWYVNSLRKTKFYYLEFKTLKEIDAEL